MLEFHLKKQEGLARRGELVTHHGTIQTPAFMPVGTQGTVKAMMPESVASTGAEILLGNTYHLMLRPGAERVAEFGGLHKFMNWNKPILTDSGGFQVMSLSKLRKLTEEGVKFRSHLSGQEYFLTPERSVEIQYLLDSNITMCLDECVAYPAEKKRVEKSMLMSMRWAERCRKAFVERDGYGIFGIVQGGVFHDLRSKSYELLSQMGFDGYSIGGLAVGEPQSVMFDVLEKLTPQMDTKKPRYLMGVGTPADIVGGVLRGVDMFDCVMPSRSGRTGKVFTREGALNIHNACHKDSHEPLDRHCNCPACRNYTRGYIHHLFHAKEILGPMLLTWHNIQFYEDLMKDIRKALEENRYQAFADEFFAKNLKW